MVTVAQPFTLIDLTCHINGSTSVCLVMPDVGCHPGTKNSLGRLANAELRKWKSIAHRVFDPLWRDGTHEA